MKIIIIGNGISGITTARNIRKLSDDEITVISGESDYFFSRTALMYVYMGHLKLEHTKPYEDNFWKKNRINLKKAWVKNIDFLTKEVVFENNERLSYDKLVIATGSKPKFLGCKGEKLMGVQGLYSLQDLEKLQNFTLQIKQAVIVGGGLIGVELAEMLHSRGISVKFLVRESSFWRNALPKEESEMITKHIQSHGIEFLFETEIKEIIGTDRVEAIITNCGERIDCQFVGVTIGVQPNIVFLQNTVIDTNKGILVNAYLETNMPDVYAIGDCAEHRMPPNGRKSIEQIWYSGSMMGETLAKTLTGTKTKYLPNVFFNSAKFFNIEYQVYGQMTEDLNFMQKSFFWQHPQKDIALRINYLPMMKNKIIGIHAFGMRLRQDVCTAWITEGKDIDWVNKHLEKANFNPEFQKVSISLQ